MSLSQYHKTSLGRIYLLTREQLILSQRSLLRFSVALFLFALGFKMLPLLYGFDLRNFSLKYEDSFRFGDHLLFYDFCFLLAYSFYYYYQVNKFCNLSVKKALPSDFLLPLTTDEKFVYLILKGFLTLLLSIVVYYLFTLVCYLPVVGSVPLGKAFQLPNSIQNFCSVCSDDLLSFLLSLFGFIGMSLVPFYFCIKMRHMGSAMLMTMVAFLLFFLIIIGNMNIFYFYTDLWDVLSKFLNRRIGLSLFVFVVALLDVAILWGCYRALKRKELR